MTHLVSSCSVQLHAKRVTVYMAVMPASKRLVGSEGHSNCRAVPGNLVTEDDLEALDLELERTKAKRAAKRSANSKQAHMSLLISAMRTSTIPLATCTLRFYSLVLYLCRPDVNSSPARRTTRDP